MGAPREIHAAAAGQLEGALGLDALVGDGGLSPERRQTFALRLDRYWPDLEAAVTEVHPDSGRGGRAADPAGARRCDGVRRAPGRPAPARPASAADPRLAAAAGDVRLRVLRRPVRGRPQGRGQAPRPPRGPRRHLPPPDAAAGAARGRQRRRATPSGTTARSGADLGTTDDLRDLATTLRGQGISLVMDLVLNHVAREHDWAVRARAGDAESSRYRDYFHVFPDRDLPDQLRADAAGGVPGLRARQLHLGRRARGLGLDDVQRVAVGPQLGQPGGAGRVRRDHPVAGQPRRRGVPARRDRVPLEADGHQLPEPARGARAHPGAARADPDRGAGRGVQGRGDRGAARPGAVPRHRPARRPGQRPRLPQQPDGADLVDARHRQHDPGPAGARARCRRRPSTGTWITYVRCHDDIGWAIDDSDAHAAGVTGPGHRHFLSDWYAGTFPGSWAEGLVFQANPATGDQRISGTRGAGRAARRQPPPTRAALAGSSWRTRSPPAGAGSP